MAKRKRATALFEVIGSNSRGLKQAQTAGNREKPSTLAGIGAWFSRSRGPISRSAPPRPTLHVTPITPRPVATEMLRDTPTSPSTDAATSTPWDPTREEIPESAADGHADHDLCGGGQPDIDHTAAAEQSEMDEPSSENAQTNFESAASEYMPPRPQSIAMSLDPERRQVSLRMSYTSAIVGGFTVLVIIGLAVIVGEHVNRGPTPVLAQQSTDSLRRGPAHPDVLNIRQPSVSAGEARLAGSTVSVGGPSGSRSANTTPGAPKFNEPHLPAPFVAHDARRTLGLNYIVVQSYGDEKMAAEAAGFLNQHNIGCTIERDLRGWGKMFVVVGIDGFSSPSSPEFKEAIARIEKLGAQFAAPRSFKAFKPSGYKWDKQTN